MKKIITALLIISLLPVFSIPAAAANVTRTSQRLTVDGVNANCEIYNIDGYNYFKLRDIAALLMETGSRFSVGYDSATQTASVTTGANYTKTADDLVIGPDQSSTAVPSSQVLMIDGARNTALSAFNIGGYNFFKLRDLGTALNFDVAYDQGTNTMIVTSRRVSGQPSEEHVELTAKEIYARCSPAVFFIRTNDIDGQPYALGSGFFIDENGIAVTNHHVLENALSATATLTDGRTVNISGVLFFDAEQDYAVIKVDGSGFPTLKVGDSSAVVGGEQVYAIGNPEGLTNTISDGLVSNPRREEYHNRIQISTPITHGSSGGALINSYGEVIGITQGGKDVADLNFAVPINDVLVGRDLSSYGSNNIYTMPQYAAQNEIITYEKRPGIGEYCIAETEPNDIYYGDIIVNGTTMFGTIDGNDLDIFTVYCNTTGTIDVVLLSGSPVKYLRDLTVGIVPANDEQAVPVRSDYVTLDSGDAVQYLRFNVSRPGVYAIFISSKILYQTESIQTDYNFYYLFTPSGIPASALPDIEQGSTDQQGPAIGNTSRMICVYNYPVNVQDYIPKFGYCTAEFSQEINPNKCPSATLKNLTTGKEYQLRTARGATEFKCLLVLFDNKLEPSCQYEVVIPPNSVYSTTGDVCQDEVVFSFTTAATL